MSTKAIKRERASFQAWLQKESTAGLVFSLPFIVGFLMFMAIPMGLSLYYSFCKAIGLYRAVYYLPSIIGGSVAVAILWRRIFESNGTLNAILSTVFPGMAGFNWFSEGPAIWVLIILTVWQFGSSMLIFLSSLKQIPRELYEAADVDGATHFHQFWTVTLPLLTPTIFFNLVQQTINSFLAFTQSKLITNGAPRNSTLFYTVYQYNKAFPASGKSQMGYASALAWIMLLIVSLVTILLFWTRKKWVYDG